MSFLTILQEIETDDNEVMLEKTVYQDCL